MFDTALTRLLDSPADLFAEMERRLLIEAGPAATGLALARECAERDARIAAHTLRGAEEIGYQAILDRLPAPWSGFRHAIRRIEFACEAETLVAVPDILAFTRALSKRGIRFCFVSDMYLPASVIAERLASGGYSGWAGLFVSSETGAGKHSGRQWAVLADAFPGARILHVGDDQHADIELPRTLGIDTIGYTRARSARRTALPFSPAALPFSRAQRAAVLRSRADPDAVRPETAFWSDLGRVWGGIVLSGFVRWLEAEVARHRIERLCFCARDGWLIRQCWRASGAAARTGLDGDYLEVARRPLNLACGWAASSADALDQNLLGFLASSDGGVTVRNALRRAGLEGDAAILAGMAAAFGGLDTRLVWPDGTGLFERLLLQHSAAVQAALAPEHAATIGFLRQQGLFDDARIGLVDLGWHANLQRSLRMLADSERAPVRLHGFYYGLWPPAKGNRLAAGPADSAFASDFEPAEENPGLTDAVEMLEELHTAPHGTVLGYRQDGQGTWRALLADDAAERAQFERAARPFQSACVETVTELFGTGRCGSLRLHEITPEVVRATLAAVSLSPQGEELARLGGLGHHATFDHARFETLVPDGLPVGAEGRDAVLRRCGWRMGTALRWMERAGDTVPEVRDWVRHVMKHYGERVLGRLG